MNIKKSFMAVLASTSLFSSLLAFHPVQADALTSFGMTTSAVNFRQSASLSGHIFSVIPKNAGIQILGDSNNWTKISYYTTIGWVYSPYVVKLQSNTQQTSNPTPASHSVFVSDNVNFRTSPQLNASIYQVLPSGTSINLIKTSGSWDEITYGGKTGWVYSSYVSSSSSQSGSVRLNVPVISQFPELHNGCEVTNLAMVLQYAGVNVDKMTLANQVAKDTTPLRRNADGSIASWGNPNYGFVGDVTGRSIGYAVYHQPIANLMNKYLPGRVLDLTGSSFDTILAQVKTGKPVLVITNSHFVPESWGWFTYKDEYGNTLKANWDEHAVTITGYDNNYVYINNSITGRNEKWNRQNFELAWEQFGNQAITYR